MHAFEAEQERRQEEALMSELQKLNPEVFKQLRKRARRRKSDKPVAQLTGEEAFQRIQDCRLEFRYREFCDLFKKWFFRVSSGRVRLGGSLAGCKTASYTARFWASKVPKVVRCAEPTAKSTRTRCYALTISARTPLASPDMSFDARPPRSAERGAAARGSAHVESIQKLNPEVFKQLRKRARRRKSDKPVAQLTASTREEAFQRIHRGASGELRRAEPADRHEVRLAAESGELFEGIAKAT